MSDAVAKSDFAKLHLALARRALGIPVEVPELDGQRSMLDESDEPAVVQRPAKDVDTGGRV